MRRFVEAVIILVFLSLSWYGAEMLLYDYCQPSIVKAFVAVAIALGISGNMEKERVMNERKRQLAKGITDAIKKAKEEKARGE